MRTFPRLLSAAALVALAACQERLAAPGECPGVCPGDRSEIRDTVLLPVFGRDSTYIGFTAAGQGISLRLSNGLDATQEIGVVRFVSRPDLIPINGTAYPYTIDSVALSVVLQARDPNVTNLQLVLYRLPGASTVDSTRTYAEILASLTPANLIDSIPIPDTLRSGVLRKVFTGAALAAVQPQAGEGGVLAVAYRLSAPSPTGIRIGANAGGSAAPGFTTYFVSAVPDTALQRQPPLPRLIGYNGYVSSTTVTVDTTTITAGGVPSARALIRFDLPPRLRDSTSFVRATLELTPLQPLTGLAGDSVALDVRALLADLGAKSPRLASSPRQILFAPLIAGSSAVVQLDVTSLVDLWQPPNKLPASLFIALTPEASSFTRAVFGSTRKGVPPKLRLTYAIPFPFETP